MTVADWYRDDVYPKVLNRHPNCNELDYLFFPKVENREKLFNRIRKNFERLSDELGLFVKEGRIDQSMFTDIHSSQEEEKEVLTLMLSL